MKVYVVKRIDGKYLSGYSNYDYRLESPCQPCWTEKLYNAKTFEEYEEADNFCNTVDCQIVQCYLLEETKLTDYTKQVRKEVVQELKEKIEKRNNGIRHSNHSEQYKDGYSGCCCDLEEILDQIQGETNG